MDETTSTSEPVAAVQPETQADPSPELPQPTSGGQAVVQKYGREYMSELGKRGSRAVIRKYGLRYFSEIAARNKGVKKRRKKQPEAASETP
ncbi:MAG: hypothetical protein FJX77_18095, partial [Armatimonadetes bacterium]|nr:hypothetical protein [Armatimonadota bacterium]